MGRLMVWCLGLALLAAPMSAFAADGVDDEIALRRHEDAAELVLAEEDDDGFRDGATGGSGTNDSVDATGNSNDATGSGYSAVSRDRDLSRGDRTRDWTRDGAGDGKRDWTGGHTNDGSRNDTR